MKPSDSEQLIWRLIGEVTRLSQALELITRPRRPDGTYNRSRKACEEVARAALARFETGPPDLCVCGPTIRAADLCECGARRV